MESLVITKKSKWPFPPTLRHGLRTQLEETCFLCRKDSFPKLWGARKRQEGIFFFIAVITGSHMSKRWTGLVSISRRLWNSKGGEDDIWWIASLLRRGELRELISLFHLWYQKTDFYSIWQRGLSIWGPHGDYIGEKSKGKLPSWLGHAPDSSTFINNPPTPNEDKPEWMPHQKLPHVNIFFSALYFCASSFNLVSPFYAYCSEKGMIRLILYKYKDQDDGGREKEGRRRWKYWLEAA